MKVTVFGIPSCGTVKKAEAWLNDKGVNYESVDLRDAAPSRSRIQRWMKVFGFKPMRNTSGGSYRALGEEKSTWESSEWLDAFAADAMLLKRPIVEIDGEPVLVGFREDEFKERFK